MKVRHNLFELINELERRDGRKYPVAEVAKESGISRQSLSAWVNNPEVEQFRSSTLIALKKFFEAKGMPLEIGDLITFEEPNLEQMTPTHLALAGA